MKIDKNIYETGTLLKTKIKIRKFLIEDSLNMSKNTLLTQNKPIIVLTRITRSLQIMSILFTPKVYINFKNLA